MSDPADPSPSGLSSRMARLNPFKSKSRRHDSVDDDDKGEEIDANTVAGGGHRALPTDVTQPRLRVSRTLKSFLAREGILSEDDAEGLNALLDMPTVCPPAHVLDRSRPLPEYFISSSHNTYLMAHQLFGTSTAEAYETTLKAGARCIEIDAWYVGGPCLFSREFAMTDCHPPGTTRTTKRSPRSHTGTPLCPTFPSARCARRYATWWIMKRRHRPSRDMLQLRSWSRWRTIVMGRGSCVLLRS